MPTGTLLYNCIKLLILILLILPVSQYFPATLCNFANGAILRITS